MRYNLNNTEILCTTLTTVDIRYTPSTKETACLNLKNALFIYKFLVFYSKNVQGCFKTKKKEKTLLIFYNK